MHTYVDVDADMYVSVATSPRSILWELCMTGLCKVVVSKMLFLNNCTHLLSWKQCWVSPLAVNGGAILSSFSHVRAYVVISHESFNWNFPDDQWGLSPFLIVSLFVTFVHFSNVLAM